jgi:hypothetical protein
MAGLEPIDRSLLSDSFPLRVDFTIRNEFYFKTDCWSGGSMLRLYIFCSLLLILFLNMGNFNNKSYIT